MLKMKVLLFGFHLIRKYDPKAYVCYIALRFVNNFIKWFIGYRLNSNNNYIVYDKIENAIKSIKDSGNIHISSFSFKSTW